MTAVFCRNAADRKAETWARELTPFVALEFAVSDAAKGITKAVAQAAEARRDAPSSAPLEHGLDVFHTTMEARRVRTLALDEIFFGGGRPWSGSSRRA